MNLARIRLWHRHVIVFSVTYCLELRSAITIWMDEVGIRPFQLRRMNDWIKLELDT